MTAGPRIYNLFPPLIGSIEKWTSHLDRIAGMGFDWLFLNPFHQPGFSGSLYAVKDYFQLNPLFRGNSRKVDDALLAEFTAAAARHGLAVMMDLVINHTSKDSVLVHEHPEWFVHEPDGSLHSPRAVDPDNPDKVTVWGDLAAIDYGEPARAEITGYWRSLVRHYIGLGFRGFRADAAYQVPPPVWRDVIAAAREEPEDVIFAAETLGCRLEQVTALHEAGFDYLFNSAKWWDFKAPWLLEQYETLRHIAPTIAFPESHDTERLARELAARGVTAVPEVEAIYRQRYVFAATFSTGLMMPAG
jgi:starch synthase (maltosyl-transferring)